jgi:SAM-dependent methyltransferase
MPRFQPKLTRHGHAFMNVGCGWKMHCEWTNLDFSPYARLVHHPHLVRLLDRCGLITGVRRERLSKVDPEILCWDLRRGMPFADGAFDAVYHSHFLEHLEREAAPIFLAECYRVLKPGGLLRVVVPDWHLLTQAYLVACRASEQQVPDAPERHFRAMTDLIEQIVRTDGAGAPTNALSRRAERWLRGGADSKLTA